MEIVRVYVNRDDLAVVTCPNCATAKTVNVGKFKGRQRRIHVRCKCQKAFPVSFEFRNSCRKETYLPGYYTKLSDGKERGMVVVKNISVTGVGFDADSTHKLNQGDEVSVRFMVDDMRRNRSNRKRMEVERHAVVRWVKDGHVGCEFKAWIGYDTVNAVSGYYAAV